jgi:hypothetical protein
MNTAGGADSIADFSFETAFSIRLSTSAAP